MPALSDSDVNMPPPRQPLASRYGMAVQFALYVVVGGLSFLADMAVFLSLLPFGYALALAPGFVAGTLTNYLLSRLIAFQTGRYPVMVEIAMLATVALTGAVLTVILVVVMVQFGMNAVAAKIVATPIVLVWNFLGRRYLVFRPDIPEGMRRLLRGAAVGEDRRND